MIEITPRDWFKAALLLALLALFLQVGSDVAIGAESKTNPLAKTMGISAIVFTTIGAWKELETRKNK